MTSQKELSDFERKLIIGGYKFDFSAAIISHNLNFHSEQ